MAIKAHVDVNEILADGFLNILVEFQSKGYTLNEVIDAVDNYDTPEPEIDPDEEEEEEDDDDDARFDSEEEEEEDEDEEDEDDDEFDD
jgi:hypothetical protein